MKNKPVRVFVALLAILLAVPACGGGGSETSGEVTPRATPSEDAGGGSGAGILADSDCREYATAFAGFNPDPVNPTSASSLREIAAFMEKVADDVPNEISEDFRTLGAALRTYAEGTGDINFTDPAAMAGITPEQLQKIQEALKDLDTEQVRAAANNIENFIKEHCPQG
ncbi:hypothetical protein BH23ACT12_BH23ACT12_13940 [soil metagenome]